MKSWETIAREEVAYRADTEGWSVRQQFTRSYRRCSGGSYAYSNRRFTVDTVPIGTHPRGSRGAEAFNWESTSEERTERSVSYIRGSTKAKETTRGKRQTTRGNVSRCVSCAVNVRHRANSFRREKANTLPTIILGKRRLRTIEGQGERLVITEFDSEFFDLAWEFFTRDQTPR